MIRRDYIVRMIEEFIQALARINSLKKDRRWEEASGVLDTEFKRLMGTGAPGVARLSEAELVGALLRDGPTHLVRHKTQMLAALLKEAGDVAAAQDRMEESHECYRKALHLLLDTLAGGEEFEYPDFVPTIEMLREALRGASLPAGTYTMLMQHYERTGQFAKAEDELFAILEAHPGDCRVAEFGIAFYHRLLAQSDAALEAANLPRAEVAEGLRELERRLDRGED